ncbi:replication protein A 70 kDa DNA-binding subunit A-like [Cryptomeria japonica]|uniref:replication protein A 70 kDa DNA-binding subunit A-like n=1 Tax=Cryptomeria japonica TaxID=3369 RepID=UPI0027D9E7EB|nr:replication protein A 70 kDa DNA-binding subunit A-like [Cryptomeria japonica]
MTSLTIDAIKLIVEGAIDLSPCIQIFFISTFGRNPKQTTLFRLEISDGTHKHKATLPKKYDDYIISEEIKIGSIIKLSEYNYPKSSKTWWITIIRLEIVSTIHEMIGESVSLDADQYCQMDQAAQLAPTSNIGVENLQNSGTLSQTKVLFGVKRPQSSSGVLSIITPIKNLNPFQTRWTIKVRVTMKKEIHQYNKQTGNGRVFSFNIIDNEGTKARVSSFNNMADAHYGNIDIGATYKISGGVVKSANKIYNKLNSGIKITLVLESIVTPCEDDPSIPKNHFSFMPINEILEQRNNSVIDVIGVVICVEPSSTIKRRDGT